METESKKDAVTENTKQSIGIGLSSYVDTSTSTQNAATKDDDMTNPMDIDTAESTDPIMAEMRDNNAPSEKIITDNRTDKSSEILERVLYRLTAGLPKCELNLIVQESNDCEVALLEEIRMLEEALVTLSKDEGDAEITDGIQGDETAAVALQNMLESPITTLDRFYTASAVLGRLRNDMAVPSASNMKAPNRSATEKASPAVESNEDKAFNEFTDPNSPLHLIYTETVVDPETLLALWKKISMNRAAFVFKRPVKSEEAPGYTDRIYFPMDLSLVRKRIITNNIQTYVDFHHALALISHNCVKYNGRDTDYGRVARDFEAMVDHTIVQAVYHAASNLDGRSNVVETSDNDLNELSKLNNPQGTPISVLKQSPVTENEKQDSLGGDTTATVADSTNVAATTANDSRPIAPIIENVADEMLIAS